MPRLTPTQTVALARWWDLAQNAGYGGFNSRDLISAAASIARDAGSGVTFAESQAIAVLFGYARRMSNAADALQSALDTDYIDPSKVSVPPWARDEAAMNTAPIWHVSYQFTYIDADGIQQTDYKTSVFEMTMPDTVGDLADAIDEDAQALASKYQVTFVSTSLVQILAVLSVRTVPVHKLRPNEIVWTPPVVAFFDTETRWVKDGDREIHHMRCWSARLDVRRHRSISAIGYETESGESAADLAEVLAGWSRTHPTLWVYAHNLAFDLTVSGITTLLREYGYEVREFAIDSTSPFVRMGTSRSRVTLADSFGWLPGKLEETAAVIGETVAAKPANDAPLAAWFKRCGKDTEILARAMLQLMDWWDTTGLGKWSVTGSASGWNAMRHKINAGRFVINPDPAGIHADRSAIYGGRRGLWVHGKLPSGAYSELDFVNAYPSIAASLPLPLERLARFDNLPLDHRWLNSERHGVIAKVRIVTGRAAWPVRAGGRVWYPIGEFWTTLAAPDIAEALAAGAVAEIGPGYVHRLGYALKPWADWCLAISGGDDPQAPAVARAWAKHCGRAIIGKWAQRGYQTTLIGPAPRTGWWASEGWNHTAGVHATIVDFDGRRWQCSATGDGDNCYPAVLAWVESYTRVRLGRLIDSLPFTAIVSCDTDGLIVNLRQLGAWRQPVDALWPLQARIKNRYSSVEITGPQHMTLGSETRMAGIPKGAKRLPDGRLIAALWPKMVWQMGHGEQGSYVRPDQSYRTASTYAPGWVTSGNIVLPVETAVTSAGSTVIMAWPETRYAKDGFKLGETQNAALERYRHGKETERTRERKAGVA